ncbi:hypothetical protein Efla_003336 [Eimeria flavescens]
MVVNNDEAPWAGGSTPTFDNSLSSLTGKRARSTSQPRCTGLLGTPETLAFLQKLSQDSISDLSEGLRDESVHAFPVFHKALEELTQSALEVSRMLEELNSTKQSRVTENAALSHQLAEMRVRLTEQKLELAQVTAQRQAMNELSCFTFSVQLEEAISAVKLSSEEKESARAYVDSTSKPIEELVSFKKAPLSVRLTKPTFSFQAAQRLEARANLEKTFSLRVARNAELRESIAVKDKAYVDWKQEQETALEQLQGKHAAMVERTRVLDEEISELTACIAKYVEEKQKDEAALSLLRMQVDSQGFCVDLLLSRIAATREKTEGIRERLLLAAKQNQELGEQIKASKQLLPSLLDSVGSSQQHIVRLIQEEEQKHAESSSQAKALKEKVLSLQQESAAAESRLSLFRSELARIEEKSQERANQVLMFAEEMQISYPSESPANAVALIATKKTVGRVRNAGVCLNCFLLYRRPQLDSLRMALSSTQQVEEAARSKCFKAQFEVLLLSAKTTQALCSWKANYRRQQRQDLKNKREQLWGEVEAVRAEVAAAAATLAEKEALQHHVDLVDESKALCLAEEQGMLFFELQQWKTHTNSPVHSTGKWEERLAELNAPNSDSRKAIAEEELKICNENFRQQIKAMRAQHEKGMGALESRLTALREEKQQQESRIEKPAKETRGDGGGNQQTDQSSTSNRRSFSSRKKIHSRRLLGFPSCCRLLSIGSQNPQADSASSCASREACDEQPTFPAGSSRSRCGPRKPRRRADGAAGILVSTFLLLELSKQTADCLNFMKQKESPIYLTIRENNNLLSRGLSACFPQLLPAAAEADCIEEITIASSRRLEACCPAGFHVVSRFAVCLHRKEEREAAEASVVRVSRCPPGRRRKTPLEAVDELRLTEDVAAHGRPRRLAHRQLAGFYF